MNLSQYQDILNKINNNEIIDNTDNNRSSTIASTNNNENLTFVVVNKNIQAPIKLSNILIQGDKHSRKIHFIMNRYFDGVDLSNKDIFVNYKNANSETGFDTIDSITLSEDLIEFDWWVNSNVTALEGCVSIQIEISKHDEFGSIIYRNQTSPLELKVDKTVISNGSSESVDYYLDIKFLNDNSSPITYDDMKSTNVPIKVENRTIIMPSLDNIAVTQDSRSKLLTFNIQRYMDNIDLSKKTPCIKFKLLDGTGDRSFVCNQTVTETQLKFDWLLDSKVTSLVGKVEFAIEFIGYNEKKEFYCYNTLPSYIFISKGLDVDNIIEQPSASWMQSWNILADSYLRDYIKYVQEIRVSVEQALKSAGEALLAMQSAKASQISAENNAGIAWQQADRAERMANITAGNSQTVINIMNEFIVKYDKFYSEYNNIRKKDEPITKSDLSNDLSSVIDGKAENKHTHFTSDIITDDHKQFITKEERNNIKNARLKSVPISENDLDANVAEKLNRVITGGGNGGGSVSGAQIDDTIPSYSKVYSSKNTENKIATAVESAISGLDGLSDNNFTDEEKRKLARIEEDANYFTLTSISASIVNETQTRKFTTPTEKETYLDKYTKAEVDNMFSKVTSGMQWKPDVPTFEDIAKTYPDPIKDWAVSTANGDTYLFDGEAWIKIGSGKTPLATQSDNGLMSALDKKKFDGMETGANNYVHPNNHSADVIVPTNEKQFVTTAQKQAIDNIGESISDALTIYRKNSIKILESDLDTTLLEKLSNAGGTIINDNVTSYAQTYSSAIIESKIENSSDELNLSIENIIKDVATTVDIDKLFK
jgi:hypothetical protein